MLETGKMNEETEKMNKESPKDDEPTEIQERKLWERAFYLSSEFKRETDAYLYIKIIIPLCIYVIIRSFRPGTPYTVFYLTEYKDVSDAYLNNALLVLSVGCLLMILIPLGAIDSLLSYLWIVPFEMLCQVAARAIFIWGFNDTHFAWAYAANGACLGAECMLYKYRTSLVPSIYNQKVVSWTSACLYLSMALSSILSQAYVGFGQKPDRSNIEFLFEISMCSVMLSAFCALILFPNKDSSLREGTFENIRDKVKKESESMLYQKLNEICNICMGLPINDKENNWHEIRKKMVKIQPKDYKTKEIYKEINKYEYLVAMELIGCGCREIFVDKRGLYWTIYWTGFMVLQYSTDGDMQSNWIDSDPLSKWNGIADVGGLLAAFVGTFMPIILVQFTHNDEAEETLESQFRVLRMVTGICSVTCIAQYMYRNIVFLYVCHIFYQFCWAWGSAINTSHFTTA
jgi:hypothetical protein